MVYRSLYVKVVVYVAAIVVTSVSGAYLGNYYKATIPLMGVTILLVALLAVRLVRVVNQTNNTLKFFFEAVKNEDSTLKFPARTGNKSFDNLHQSLNELNGQFRDYKIQLQLQNEYYKSLLEQSASGLMAYDEKGRVAIINREARKLLGVEPFGNMSFIGYKYPDVFKAIQAAEPNADQTISTNINGKLKVLLFKGAFHTTQSGKVKIVSFQNIKPELDDQEVASWQKVVRVMAHEIMNTLSPITSLSASIRKQFFPDSEEDTVFLDKKSKAKTQKALEIISEQGEQLSRFVRVYRSIARVPDPEFKNVSVESFLSSTRVLLSDRLGKLGVAMKMRIVPKNVMLFIDEGLMQQVVVNLLCNALDAIGEVEKPEVSLVCSSYKGQVKIEVSDNGSGISQEHIDKIFIPFFTTKEHGNGIGLSLSRQIVRKHHANISISTHPGKTVVTIEGLKEGTNTPINKEHKTDD